MEADGGIQQHRAWRLNCQEHSRERTCDAQCLPGSGFHDEKPWGNKANLLQGCIFKLSRWERTKSSNLHRWKATHSVITSQWKLRTSNQGFQIILCLVPSVLCFIRSFPSINPSYRLNCLLNHNDVTMVRMENSLTARNFRTPQSLYCKLLSLRVSKTGSHLTKEGVKQETSMKIFPPTGRNQMGIT